MNADSAIINHPVHILTKENKMSPSAFIPFCEFGGNMSAMGVKIAQFDVPVCNSFQAKILNDQLCYEVDLNEFSDPNNIDKELELGFNFILDYNEDRQVKTVTKIMSVNRDYGNDWFDKFNPGATSDKEQHAIIYLDTIGE